MQHVAVTGTLPKMQPHLQHLQSTGNKFKSHTQAYVVIRILAVRSLGFQQHRCANALHYCSTSGHDHTFAGDKRRRSQQE